MLASSLQTIFLGNNMLYIDPATTTVLLSSLTSIIVSLGAVFLIWGRSIKKQVTRIFKLDANKNKQVEQDLVVSDGFVYDKEKFDSEYAIKEEYYEPEQVPVVATVADAPIQEPQEKKYFSKERIDRILPICLATFGVMLLLFVVGPLEIYANNIDQYIFKVKDFLPLCFAAGMIFVVISFSAMFFTPKILYKIFYALMVAAFVMLFLQTNFLSSIHSLGGDANASALKTGEIVLNTIIWAIALGLFVTGLIVIKKENITRVICLVLSIALLFSQVVVGTVTAGTTDFSVQNDIDKNLATNEYYKPTFMTTKNLTTISSNKNIIVFIVDRMDSVRYMEPLLTGGEFSDKEWEETFGKLDGFTYYNDYVALYGRTCPALASIVSNIERTYTKEVDVTDEQTGETKKETQIIHRADYFKTAYQTNETIIDLHKNQNYIVNIYSADYYSYDDAYEYYYDDDGVINGNEVHYVDNFIQVDKSQVKTNIKFPFLLCARMLQVSAYRSFPYLLMGVGSGVSSLTCNGLVEYSFGGDNDYEKYNTDMKQVYNAINEKEFDTYKDENENKNNFSLIHLSGLHYVDYDEDWDNFRGNEESHMDISVKNSFKIINKYIDELVKAEVYDDSTIIIMGDHSHPYNDTDALNEPRLTGMFVKPALDTGLIADQTKLTFSSKQVSQKNLWATIYEASGLTLTESQQENFGRSFFDIGEGENVTRKHYWQEMNLAYTNFYDHHYEITGAGKEFDNWKNVSPKNEDGKPGVFYDYAYYD